MMAATEQEITVRLRKPHARQRLFLGSTAKRRVIRAGRRGGKTVGIAIYAARQFLAGRRVLYATPTADQIQTFWREVKRSLAPLIDAGIVAKNETAHTVTWSHGGQARVRAKTAWDADTLRGDYADVLILDEYQLIDPDAWNTVGAPMLLDNDGDAIFIYTPPRPYQRAQGYRHAAELYAKAESAAAGDWEAFHFTSHDNPYISTEALERMLVDMTRDAYQREIMAEDTDESPGALWSRELIEQTRVAEMPVNITRTVVGVDPPGGATEAGIVAASLADGHVYLHADASTKGGPDKWGTVTVALATDTGADMIVAETNHGGDMVKHVILPILDNADDCDARYADVRASRGKAVRAEPLVAAFERSKAHIVGALPDLEDELCIWQPDSGFSPNRLDAAVWACYPLLQAMRRAPKLRVARI